MMNAKELASVYDTIMSIPGMNEQVKIDFKVSRKNVLLLSQAVRKSLIPGPGEHDHDLLVIASKESKQELIQIADEFLQRTGLAELHGKILKL